MKACILYQSDLKPEREGKKKWFIDCDTALCHFNKNKT